jgi:hypothetical protein
VNKIARYVCQIICAAVGATLVYFAFCFVFVSFNIADFGDNGNRGLCVIYMLFAAGLGSLLPKF